MRWRESLKKAVRKENIGNSEFPSFFEINFKKDSMWFKCKFVVAKEGLIKSILATDIIPHKNFQAKAKCHPDDKTNYLTGCKIALFRSFSKFHKYHIVNLKKYLKQNEKHLKKIEEDIEENTK